MDSGVLLAICFIATIFAGVFLFSWPFGNGRKRSKGNTANGWR